MPVTGAEFREALSRFASGVTVVTTKDREGRLHGITVSAFCSVSLEPPLILICIERTTGSHLALERSDAFVVHILGSEQLELSERFASPDPAKFDGLALAPGIDDIPLLSGCLVTMECRIAYSYPGGDHTIFVGTVERATVEDGEPLVYFCGGYRGIQWAAR